MNVSGAHWEPFFDSWNDRSAFIELTGSGAGVQSKPQDVLVLLVGGSGFRFGVQGSGSVLTRLINTWAIAIT